MTAVIEENLAVRCNGITKTFGTGSAKVQALRGVDLEVKIGRLLMLVGPSGCGKTTLISVMAGILDQDEGDCRIFDQHFSQMNGADRTRWRGKNIGFVFQAFNLQPTLTAAENVAVPLLINRMPWDQAMKKAMAMLSQVGLGDRAHARPAQLSGGQQQRVAIARALVHDPKLVVCDEPTSALDHQTGLSVMRLLRKLAVGKDRALVIVTHDSRTFPFADEIAHMDDGRIDRIHTQVASDPGQDSSGGVALDVE